MTDGSEEQRYTPVTYVAVGDRDTLLHSFDPFTGSVVKTGVPAFPGGYDALGHDWSTGKLYAVSGAPAGQDVSLVVIDPAKAELTTRTVSGIGGTRWALGAQNLIATMVDVECTAGNDQAFSHSKMRGTARFLPQLQPETMKRLRRESLQQCREEGPVGGGEPWADVFELAFQDHDLVAQRQDLRVLVPVAQGQQTQQRDRVGHTEVVQSE